MTTTLFIIIMIVISVALLFVVGLPAAHLFENMDAGLTCWLIATAIFFVVYCKFLAPSREQLIENDYYALMKDRPKCIDASHFNLDCKKDYIVWKRDSIMKRREYDSVKVMLDNEQMETLK